MRELSLTEIVEYAEKIELESYDFYSKAKDIVVNKGIKNLLTQLANDEIGHFNQLRNLRQKGNLSIDELEQKISLKEDALTKFVNTGKIEKDSTSTEVLKIALEREINTEQIYAMFMTFSQISTNVLEVFELLRNQEKGHANKIQKKLDN